MDGERYATCGCLKTDHDIFAQCKPLLERWKKAFANSPNGERKAGDMVLGEPDASGMRWCSEVQPDGSLKVAELWLPSRVHTSDETQTIAGTERGDFTSWTEAAMYDKWWAAIENGIYDLAPRFGVNADGLVDFTKPLRPKTGQAAEPAEEAAQMAAETAPAELRPPAEHTDKPLHWVQDDGDEPEVWFWRINEWYRYRLEQSGTPTWTRLLERLFDRPGDGNIPNLTGYRYLGPAEWFPPPAKLRLPPGHEGQRIRAERVAIFKAGACSCEQQQDSVVSREELEALGWTLDPDIGNWRDLTRLDAASPPPSGPRAIPVRALRLGDGIPR